MTFQPDCVISNKYLAAIRFGFKTVTGESTKIKTHFCRSCIINPVKSVLIGKVKRTKPTHAGCQKGDTCWRAELSKLAKVALVCYLMILQLRLKTTTRSVRNTGNP